MLVAIRRHPAAAAVAGALAIAFSAVLFRLAAVSPSTGAVLRCAFAAPVLYVLARIEDRSLGARSWRARLTASAAGVFFAVDLVLWHRAIDLVGAGLATVLANQQVIIVGLLAWLLLGERPSRRLLLGAPMVFGGVVLISGVIGERGYGADPRLGAVLGGLAGVAYAGFLLVLRTLHDERRLAGPLFDATAAAVVVAACAGLLLGDLDLYPAWPAWGWLALLAIESQVLGWLLISVSLRLLPAALTSTLLTVQPVGSVILGALIFGESPSPLQLSGAAVILCGIVVATAGRRRAVVPARDDAAMADAIPAQEDALVADAVPEPAPLAVQQSAPPGLVVEGLSRRFGRTQAVDGLSFWALRGEILALLGPNGAGKTTTMLCLAGLVRPDGGRMLLDGAVLAARRSRVLALVPETPEVFPMLTVWEHFIFVARSNRLAAGWEHAAERLLERLCLVEYRTTLGEALSKGNRQKTIIASAVLVGSPVLLLDEPMIGLDPAGQRELRALLFELRAQGHVVIVSTHLLEHVEAFCDRLLILKQGRAIAGGSVEELRRLRGERTLEDIYLDTVA